MSLCQNMDATLCHKTHAGLDITGTYLGMGIAYTYNKRGWGVQPTTIKGATMTKHECVIYVAQPDGKSREVR